MSGHLFEEAIRDSRRRRNQADREYRRLLRAFGPLLPPSARQAYAPSTTPSGGDGADTAQRQAARARCWDCGQPTSSYHRGAPWCRPCLWEHYD